MDSSIYIKIRNKIVSFEHWFIVPALAFFFENNNLDFFSWFIKPCHVFIYISWSENFTRIVIEPYYGAAFTEVGQYVCAFLNEPQVIGQLSFYFTQENCLTCHIKYRKIFLIDQKQIICTKKYVSYNSYAFSYLWETQLGQCVSVFLKKTKVFWQKTFYFSSNSPLRCINLVARTFDHFQIKIIIQVLRKVTFWFINFIVNTKSLSDEHFLQVCKQEIVTATDFENYC